MDVEIHNRLFMGTPFVIKNQLIGQICITSISTLSYFQWIVTESAKVLSSSH